MIRTLARYQRLIMGAEPRSLEGALRGLLIALFYHLSDKASVFIVRHDPQASNFLNLYTPTLLKGEGKILLAPSTVFGVVRSPGAFSCSFVDARTPTSH
nr:hypothetical protein [uncultured Duganella sp.]